MRIWLRSLLVLAILSSTSCQAVKIIAKGRPEKLTDEMVVKYVAAYRAIRAVSPGAVETIQQPGGGDLSAAGAKYGAVVNSLAHAGYKDPLDFMRVNFSVGLAFSQLEGANAEAKMDDMQASGLAQLDAALANPQVPAATKADLRKQRASIVETLHNSRVWADRVLWVTHWMNDADSIAVVQRHQAEIEAAYTGH